MTNADTSRQPRSPGQPTTARGGADAWLSAATAALGRHSLATHWRRRATRALLQSCADAVSEAWLLERLRRAGRPARVRAVRFYVLDELDNETLRSADCAGHTRTESLWLRLGVIVRPRGETPTIDQESYYCLDADTPVLFELDTTIGAPLEEQPPPFGGRFRYVKQRCWHGGVALPERKSGFRLEIPLSSSGHKFGKLSCDIHLERLSLGSVRWLDWFCSLAARVAPSLAGIRARREKVKARVLDPVREEVIRTRSLEELFTYCTTTLPQRFGARYASLFTLCTDATGSQRLVLRKTSYPGSRGLENGGENLGPDGRLRVGYYQLGEGVESITAWVATRGRGVRLHGLADVELLRTQLLILDPRLRWANSIPDSDDHLSYMAVPIATGGVPLGLLRFADKLGSDADAYFSGIDERMLTRIVDDFVAPHLRALQAKAASAPFCDHAWREPIIEGLTETFAPEAADSGERQSGFDRAMRLFFGDAGGANHLYLANRVPVNSPLITHLAVAGPLAGQFAGRPRTHSLACTLTREAISRKRWVYVHDVERAKHLGLLSPLIPQAKCVLACPINFGSGGHGAVVLHSDRLDIVPQVSGPLLEKVVRMAASMLAVRRGCRVFEVACNTC